MELLDFTAVELGERIQSKEISVKEATEAVLKAVEGKDGAYNAYISCFGEDALRQAEVQKRLDQGEIGGPLAGVPVAIKDNICVRGKTPPAPRKCWRISRRPTTPP